jgi:hypothetical protein
MLSSSDGDVQRLLKAIECRYESAVDAPSRRKLLTKAFGKVQQGQKHATAVDGLINPSTLSELSIHTQQLSRHWVTEEMFSPKVCTRNFASSICCSKMHAKFKVNSCNAEVATATICYRHGIIF